MYRVNPEVFCLKCRCKMQWKRVKLRLDPVCRFCEQKRPLVDALQASEKYACPPVAGRGTAALEQTGKTCVYCGITANSKDHVVCYLYTGKQGSRKASRRSYGQIVDSCMECNGHLGSKLIPTVVDRAHHLFHKAKVRRRYSKARLAHLERVMSQS